MLTASALAAAATAHSAAHRARAMADEGRWQLNDVDVALTGTKPGSPCPREPPPARGAGGRDGPGGGTEALPT